MKKLTVGIAIAAFVAFNLTASAAEPPATAKSVHKSHHAKRSHAKKANPYAELERFRSSGFIGAYPGDYALRKANGDCIIDLGYGRWMSCDQGGGGPFN